MTAGTVSPAAVVPFYADEAVTLYYGDAYAIVPALGVVDHVITDPPYSARVHEFARTGTGDVVRSRGADFGFDAMTDEGRRRMGEALARMVRRWVLVFSDIETAPAWREALAAIEYVRTGAWVRSAAPQFTGDRPAVGFEAITICHPAAGKRWNGGGSAAVWEYGIVRANATIDPRLHPTQKPEGLLIELVTQFTDPGDLILDPFAGSGTTLAAAKRIGRKAIGVEANAEFCARAARRLAQGALSAMWD